MLTLQKIWTWIKAYWYIPVAVIVMIISAIFMLSDNPGSKWIKEIIASYRKEIEVIDGVNAEKEKEREALRVKYEEMIAALEQAYAEQGTILDKKKKARVKELLETYKDDGEGLTAAFAAEFGMKVTK